MLNRLAGLESEYAIRFSPYEGELHPGNDHIYDAISIALREEVKTLPGRTRPGYDRLFVQNGGSFTYEFIPYQPEGGLVEGSTPECRGPTQILLYQRAQEKLLVRALPLAEDILIQQGFAGRLALLRNAHDAEGHIYGPQENYEATIAQGGTLLFYRIVLALLLPILAVAGIILWLILLPILLLVGAISFTMVGLDMLRAHRGLDPVFTQHIAEGRRRPVARALGYLEMGVQNCLIWPAVVPFSLMVRTIAFRPIVKTCTAFLVSRPIISGTGIVHADGRFGLSEKAPGIYRLHRLPLAMSGHSIFDHGNMIKALLGILLGNFRTVAGLFQEKQRLQLGLSDANRLQVAEYLKLGTTLLVLDMAEAGYIEDAPRLVSPVRALQTICDDPEITQTVQTKNGTAMTAFELQNWYLERARSWLASSETASMEAHEIVRLWAEALDAIEEDPPSLVGRIDWISKRLLIEGVGADASRDALRKVDLRYHELKDGYAARLEKTGIAPFIVSESEISRAIQKPPSETPAVQRSRFINELADRDVPAWVTWDSVQLGRGLKGKVIKLSDYRKAPK